MKQEMIAKIEKEKVKMDVNTLEEQKQRLNLGQIQKSQSLCRP